MSDTDALPVPSFEIDRERDPRFNQYAIYAERTRPYTGGILSARSLRDPKLSKRRLLRHAECLAWQVFLLAEDVAASRSYGHGEAIEAQRLRERLTEVFNLLTPAQRLVMRSRDDARRADVKGKQEPKNT